MLRIKVLCVAGARPNFMKIAPLIRALRKHPVFDPRLVHTGQHYDAAMSKVFFEDLKIPRPDIDLGVGSGSHAVQTAEIMKRFEVVLEREQPEAVLVVGDVNSTIACALVAAKFILQRPFTCKLGVRRRPIMIHVEAGLRSFDDDMPEEVNRRLTDAISDLLYVSEPAGIENLRREGVPDGRVVFAGNVMIDTLMAAHDQAMESHILETLGLVEKEYTLLTLHRPSNVDEPKALAALLDTLEHAAQQFGPVVFPVHPRTRKHVDEARIMFDKNRWLLTGPLGYLDFLKLAACARVVMTDSGGIQEEATVLGVPCLTLRDSTERPCTVSEGSNVLAGTTREGILDAFAKSITKLNEKRMPRLWDGHAADRIARSLVEMFPETTWAAIQRDCDDIRDPPAV